jgi:hypothetical protein
MQFQHWSGPLYLTNVQTDHLMLTPHSEAHDKKNYDSAGINRL